MSGDLNRMTQAVKDIYTVQYSGIQHTAEPSSSNLDKVSRSIFNPEEFTAFTSATPEATTSPIANFGNTKLPTTSITSAHLLAALILILVVLLAVFAGKYIYNCFFRSAPQSRDLENGGVAQRRNRSSWLPLPRFSFRTRRYSLTPTVSYNELPDSIEIPLYGLNPPLGLPIYPARVHTAERLTGGARPVSWIEARRNALVKVDSNATIVELNLSPKVLLTGTSEDLSYTRWRPVVPVSEEEGRGRGLWSESCETLVCED